MGDHVERRGEGPAEFLRRARPVIDEGLHAVAVKQRDRVRSRRESAPDRERFPFRIAFILGEAEAELARIAEGGTVDAAR